MFCNDVVWKPVAIYTTSNLFAQQMPTGSELWRATECILDCCFLPLTMVMAQVTLGIEVLKHLGPVAGLRRRRRGEGLQAVRLRCLGAPR